MFSITVSLCFLTLVMNSFNNQIAISSARSSLLPYLGNLLLLHGQQQRHLRHE